MVGNNSLELSYVQLYHPGKHGFIHGTSDPRVHGQFLVEYDLHASDWRDDPGTLSNAEVIETNHIQYADGGLGPIGHVVWVRVPGLFMYCFHPPYIFAMKPTPSVRNYMNMDFIRELHGRLQIVEKHCLDGDA